MDRGAWWATVHGVTKESDMTERLSVRTCACTTHKHTPHFPTKRYQRSSCIYKKKKKITPGLKTPPMQNILSIAPPFFVISCHSFLVQFFCLNSIRALSSNVSSGRLVQGDQFLYLQEQTTTLMRSIYTLQVQKPTTSDCNAARAACKAAGYSQT